MDHINYMVHSVYIMVNNGDHYVEQNDLKFISSGISMLKYKENNWDSYIDKMCKPRSVFTTLYHSES